MQSGPEGTVERIWKEFERRRAEVETSEAFGRLLADTRRQMEAFLKDHPAHGDAARATFHVAEIHLMAPNHAAALVWLHDLLKKHPRSPHAADARYAIADVMLAQEDNACAIEAFEDFLRLHAGDGRALAARVTRGVLLRHLGRPGEAVAALEEVRRLHAEQPSSWHALLELAVTRHLEGDVAASHAALHQVLRECPDNEIKETARRQLRAYVRAGQEVPAFRAKDTAGREVAFDPAAGRVAVVYFFDPGVTMAHAEAAFLRGVWEELRGKEILWVGVSTGPDRRALDRMRQACRVAWPVIHGPEGESARMASLFEVHDLPALHVIDRKGRLRFYNLSGRDLPNALEKLLQEK